MTNNLKKLRESAGLTQAEAADKMGMSKSGYIKIEHGDRRLTAQHISKAAATFNVNPSAVLGFDENPIGADDLESNSDIFGAISDPDRYFAVLEGILEGLGLGKGRADELKRAYQEALAADLNGLTGTADLEARRALARILAKKSAHQE